jgi:uncharacterized protein DUF1844
VEYADELNEHFAWLILHLAQLAAFYFGDLVDGEGASPETDLAGAGQVIETLGVLQEKTRGNLTAAEAKGLEDLLYELRLRFVQAQGGGKRIIEP